MMLQNGSNDETKDLNYDKRLQVVVAAEHLEMMKKIAVHYRVPRNLSHAVRLMIEDKFWAIEVEREGGGGGV